ncbi:hypothetical protein SLS62_003597 [Diatrype stigma]|uniref:Uncharacterized protein n=1 Tax=Diatrype stigma TaxID=117547 RepID=A0AAN9V4G2_9PEZI
MDAIKNAISGNKSSSTTGETTSNQQSATGQQDYGDKAFKAANDKAGWGLDDKKREGVTDMGRTAYEKATGNKVDAKYSN